jgi:hypothetical protein
VIVRGIGPSLSVINKLADPTLELRDAAGTLIKQNDNWRDSPDKQAIFNTGISPKDDLESAIIATVVANGATYSAILRGVNGGTGIGVVEVYDLDSKTADSKLANISTRGLVLTGDNVMIAGTIVVSPLMQNQKVIIRALGPSLSIVNKLADPTLELRDAYGALLKGNDNWESNPEPDRTAIFDSGVAPTDPYEPAIAATLSPGANYTAIVRDYATPTPAPPPTVTRTQYGSSDTVEIQRVQFARAPVGGVLRLTFKRPLVIMSGQPGDKAALEDSITIPWNATATEIKAAILASSNFYKYDQNNHLTAGPDKFHALFDSGGGLGIAGNEGSRREPVITRSGTDLSDFTIQFGTLTTGAVGVRNPWIAGLPLVEVDDSSIIYNGGIAVVEIYATQ